MKSPFPGFDPYLQEYWSDVHQRLITYTAEAMQEQLPPNLFARVEERVFVESEGEQWRTIVPDTLVKEWHSAKPSQSSVVHADRGGAAVAEPVHSLMLSNEPVTEGYIEIRDKQGRQVITVIEIVSPANKSGGEGQRQYLQKQEDVMQSSSVLVEIDFIRGGNHVLMGGRAAIAPQHRTGALAAVHTPWHKGLVNVYAFPLRESLKALPVPLRSTDEPIAIDLQALMEKAYAIGRYDQFLDYRSDPQPPLPPADSAWADALLKQAGLRAD